MAHSGLSSNDEFVNQALSRAASQDDEICQDISDYMDQYYKNSKEVDAATFWKAFKRFDNKRAAGNMDLLFVLCLLRHPHRESLLTGRSRLTANQYLLNLTDIFRKFESVIPKTDQVQCSEVVKRAVRELHDVKVLQTREDTEQMIRLVNKELKQDFNSVVDKIHPPQPRKRAKSPVPKTPSTRDGHKYQIVSVNDNDDQYRRTPIFSDHSRRSHGEVSITPHVADVLSYNERSPGQDSNEDVAQRIVFPGTVSLGNQTDLEEEGFHDNQNNTLFMMRKEQQKKDDESTSAPRH